MSLLVCLVPPSQRKPHYTVGLPPFLRVGQEYYCGGIDRGFSVWYDARSVGKYAAVLDCVRFGPSASNNQPWRIVRQSSQSAFHFYLKRTWGYDKFNARIDLQRVDIGIAMCHFELAVRDIGLTGRWAGANPGLETGTAEYIISWVES